MLFNYGGIHIHVKNQSVKEPVQTDLRINVLVKNGCMHIRVKIQSVKEPVLTDLKIKSLVRNFFVS